MGTTGRTRSIIMAEKTQEEKDVIEEEKGVAEELTKEDVTTAEPEVTEEVKPVVETSMGDRTLSEPIVDVSDYAVKNNSDLYSMFGPSSDQTGTNVSDRTVIEKERVDQYKPSTDIQSVLSGEITQINGVELNPQTIALAQQGDPDAVALLSKYIDEESFAKSSDVKTIFANQAGEVDESAIAKAVKLASPDASEEILDDQFNRVKVRSYVQKNMRFKLKSLGVGKFDPNVAQLMVDYYSTGQFFTETFKRVGTLSQGLIGQLPFAVGALLPEFLGALYDSTIGDGDFLSAGTKSFSEAWSERKPEIASKFASYKNFVENGLGMSGLTYGSLLNDDLKKRYIEEFGKEAYERLYLLPGPDGKKFEIPMVNEKQARDILNYGFDELPLIAQFGAILPENVSLGSAFAVRRNTKGILQLDEVKNARLNGTKYSRAEDFRDLDDVQAIRKIEIEKKANFVTKSWRRFTAKMGQSVGYKGGIGDVKSTQRYTEALNILDDSITRNQSSIDAVLKGVKVNPTGGRYPDLATLVEEGENLATQRMKLKFGTLLTNAPYFTGALKAEVLITGGQLAGRTWVSPALNISPEAGEGIGALMTIVGLGPQLPINLGKYVVTKFDQRIPVLSSVFKFIEDIPSELFALGKQFTGLAKPGDLKPNILRGLLVDRRFDQMENVLGRSLAVKEKQSMQLLAKAMARMKPEQREMIFKSIDEYRNLKARLLKPFQKELDDAKDANLDIEFQIGLEQQLNEADEAFSLTFAHVTGLAPLMSLETVAAGKLNVRKFNLGEAFEHQIEAENMLAAAQVGMTRFKKMLLEKTGVDTADRDFSANWVANFEKAADSMRLGMNERKIEYLDLLEKYKTGIMTDPNYSLDKKSLTKMAELEVQLNAGANATVDQKRVAYIESINGFMKILNKRGEEVDALKGTKGARQLQAKHVEESYDAKIEADNILAKLDYLIADDYALKNNLTFDITDSVLGLIVLKKGLGATKQTAKDFKGKGKIQGLLQKENSKILRSFFTEGGQFLSGREGSLLYKSFQDMAKRSLLGKNGIGLDKDELQVMLDLHRSPTILDDSGKTITNDDFIGENASFLELALHLSAKDGSTFRPFTALPSELEGVRRHLLRKSDFFAKNNVAKASQYSDAAGIIDNIYVTQDKVYNDLIQKGRNTYRDFHFDDKRRGSSKEKIDNSLLGRPDRVSKISGTELKHNWSVDNNPQFWHDNINKGIVDVIEGKPLAADKTNLLIEDFTAFWGNRVKVGPERNEVAFDLTTESGRLRFENASTMLQMNMFQYFAASKKKILNTIYSRVRGDVSPTGETIIKPPGSKDADYDFTMINRIKEAQDQLKVPVVRGYDDDGTARITYESIFDMTELIAKEKDIMKLMDTSNVVRQEHERLVKDVNDLSSQLSNRVDGVIATEQRTVKDFETLANIRDPKQFYVEFVQNGTVGRIEDLKEKFLNLRTRDDGPIKAIPRQQAEKEFKQGLMYMVTNGLLAMGEFGTKSARTLKGFGGKTHNVSVMGNIDGLSREMFDNPSTEKILRMVYDEEHLNYLRDITRHLEFASGASLVKYEKTGMTRGVSPNELISRAFNLARGMVSPTYVAAELAIRMASQHGIELVGMAARSKKAADILYKVMENPKSLSKEEVATFSTQLRAYVAAELARKGTVTPSYVSQGEMFEQEQKGNVQFTKKQPYGGYLKEVYEGFNFKFPLENQEP